MSRKWSGVGNFDELRVTLVEHQTQIKLGTINVGVMVSYVAVTLGI
jgi:hypothetical protein